MSHVFINGQYFKTGNDKDDGLVDRHVILMAFWRRVLGLPISDVNCDSLTARARHNKVNKSLYTALRTLDFDIHKVETQPCAYPELLSTHLPVRVPNGTHFMVSAVPRIRRQTAPGIVKFKGMQCKHVSTYLILLYLQQLAAIELGARTFDIHHFVCNQAATLWPERITQRKIQSLARKKLIRMVLTLNKPAWYITTAGADYVARDIAKQTTESSE